MELSDLPLFMFMACLVLYGTLHTALLGTQWVLHNQFLLLLLFSGICWVLMVELDIVTSGELLRSFN